MVTADSKRYPAALSLVPEVARRQRRVGAAPPGHLGGLRWLIEEANGWLPSACGRVLWITGFEQAVAGAEEFLMAIRRGFSEQRGPEEAPGHYFCPQPWQERDQLLVSREHAAALSVLVGLAVTVLMTGSYGWLVAEDAAERIEFWEGNIFFHSADAGRLKAAKVLLEDCPPVR